MKKTICVLMMFVVLFGFNFNTNAMDTSHNTKDEIISFEEIQKLFPDILLREDGFANDYESDDMYANSVDEKVLGEMLSCPVKSYDAEYHGGICTLNIYDNGMYDVVGYEKLDTMVTRNPGAEVYGSKYRSYYWHGPIGFYYTYTIYSSGSYSQFHNLSNPTQPLVSYDPNWSFSAGSTGYVRQTQTASLPAEVYGLGNFTYIQGVTNRVKLITNVSYGNISVAIQNL